MYDFYCYVDEVCLLEVKFWYVLKNCVFVLYYQLVIDFQSEWLIGVEVLVCLLDMDWVNIGFVMFILVVELVGLIGELGDWVVIEVCWQYQVWCS